VYMSGGNRNGSEDACRGNGEVNRRSCRSVNVVRALDIVEAYSGSENDQGGASGSRIGAVR
jgi:hypothetical protein